jgi:hypothetical protein
MEGDTAGRLSWSFDRPAYPGDQPGSLTALHDSSVPAGRLGFTLPRPFTEEDTFTAAAVFVLEPDGFSADPLGFFQISWGLWNSATTGLERTGTPADFAGDTFELLEFAYFPNLSPFFGGPFLSPALFGAADADNSLFPVLGSFANFAFGSVEVELPLGEVLLGVVEHRPDEDAVVISVHQVLGGSRLLPLPGAVTVIPTAALGVPLYELNTFGLTLWTDGFGGDEPALQARVTYHRLVARPGRPVRLKSLLHAPPVARP